MDISWTQYKVTLCVCVRERHMKGRNGDISRGGNTPFPQIWEKPNGDLAQIFTHYFPLGFNSLGYVPPTLGSEKGWAQLMAMILGLSLIAKKESSQKKKNCPAHPSPHPHPHSSLYPGSSRWILISSWALSHTLALSMYYHCVVSSAFIHLFPSLLSPNLIHYPKKTVLISRF